jgi:hypothetical protein
MHSRTPPHLRRSCFQVKYQHPLYGVTTLQRKIVFFLLAFILLSSCTPRGSATPTPFAPTFTPESTITPTLESTSLTILVLPADMPQTESNQYQKLVYDLAQANGMRFQLRNALTPADVALEGTALKVVIALPPDPGLESLAAAAPGVEFLAIGIPGLAVVPNLSTIGATGLPVDQQAFLAGYIAGMVAPEWRVGILSQKDTPGGDAAVIAFANGYHFYCGDCFNPNFPGPNSHNYYPIIVRIPTDAPLSDYNGYADLLIHNIVNVVYLYPDIANPDVITHLAQNSVLLISQTLPGEDIRPNWIASIQADPISALKLIYPDLVAGKGGQVVPTQLFLTDINPDLLSDAKMRLVQDVLTGLQNGTIGTGVNP